MYIATPYSLAANEPGNRDAWTIAFEVFIPALLGLPDFLAKAKYQTPVDNANCALQYTIKTKETFFGFLAEDARLGSAFNQAMPYLRPPQQPWYQYYPITERLAPADSLSGPPLVDVGGGIGYELTGLSNSIELQGQLVLQDLPQVVAHAKSAGKLAKNIKAIEHDFFTPQPESCQGAAAYLFRLVLHNWADVRCEDILSHIRDAMVPGMSRLLINEVVVADTGASIQDTSLDVLMMALLAGKERTEKQWGDILGKVGLRITGVWHKGHEGVIEAVVDETLDETIPVSLVL